MQAVDTAVSCLNRRLTCSVDNVQVFKDSADKRLEILIKASFALADFAMQPAVAAIGGFQNLKDRIKHLVKKKKSHAEADTSEGLTELPQALCFAVDALQDSIQQISHVVSMCIVL